MYLSIRYRSGMALMLLAVVALATPAFADDQAASNETQGTGSQPEKKENKDNLQEVLITGTNIRENISDISVPTALPLTVIDAGAIAVKAPKA